MLNRFACCLYLCFLKKLTQMESNKAAKAKINVRLSTKVEGSVRLKIRVIR